MGSEGVGTGVAPVISKIQKLLILEVVRIQLLISTNKTNPNTKKKINQVEAFNEVFFWGLLILLLKSRL
ncbi:hypothetical protein D0962_34415 [Leptolyngbyaceae cyanobacterium CCMR0082]|uniref:Uncharacterized protein n=1 Tax=Adonisia turfae CCMR0082 TaxID=2304604 RepID=A0A6M0SHE0_9CYAN|nr:hypothetical protein [Adonisia turfae CCMR0082]